MKFKTNDKLEENIYNTSDKELIFKIHKNKTFRRLKIKKILFKNCKNNSQKKTNGQ